MLVLRWFVVKKVVGNDEVCCEACMLEVPRVDGKNFVGSEVTAFGIAVGLVTLVLFSKNIKFPLKLCIGDMIPLTKEKLVTPNGVDTFRVFTEL